MAAARADYRPIFSRYSGYIVSAPPKTACGGILYFVANSVRKGFSPGMKLGTACGSTPGASTTYSHGYSQPVVIPPPPIPAVLSLYVKSWLLINGSVK